MPANPPRALRTSLYGATLRKILPHTHTRARLACRPSRGLLDNGSHATRGPDQPSSGAGVSEGVSPRRHVCRAPSTGNLPLHAPPGARSAHRSVAQTAWTVGTCPRRPVAQFTDPDGDVGGAHSQKGILPCTAGALLGARTSSHARAQSPYPPSLIARDTLLCKPNACSHCTLLPLRSAACKAINLEWLRKGFSIPLGWPSCVVT